MNNQMELVKTSPLTAQISPMACYLQGIKTSQSGEYLFINDSQITNQEAGRQLGQSLRAC